MPISKRVMGIEPTYPAWKAGVLPLNYTRKKCLYMLIAYMMLLNPERQCIFIGVTGFEPAASWSQTRHSSQTELHPVASIFSLIHLWRNNYYIIPGYTCQYIF